LNTVNTTTTNMRNRFINADEAYEFLMNEVIINGVDFDNTKALFNCGFYILTQKTIILK
jgi:hypothetical protein